MLLTTRLSYFLHVAVMDLQKFPGQKWSQEPAPPMISPAPEKKVSICLKEQDVWNAMVYIYIPLHFFTNVSFIGTVWRGVRATIEGWKCWRYEIKPKGQALLSCVSGSALFYPSSPYIPSIHCPGYLIQAFVMGTASPWWDSGSLFYCQPSDMTCANGIAAPFEG